MYTTYFIIPKAVYFYCMLPALIIIIGCILFSIFYRRKVGTYYYVYVLNKVYNLSSILLCLLLFPLLMGYSLAMLYVLHKGLIIGVSPILKVILVILPLIPLITLIIVISRYLKNLEYKQRLDERLEEGQELLNDTSTLEELNPVKKIK